MGFFRRFTRHRKGPQRSDAPHPPPAPPPDAVPVSQPDQRSVAEDSASAASKNDCVHADFHTRRERSLVQHERGFSIIVAPLRVEEGNPWQAFLLGICNNVTIVALWVHRLGMPPTSVADKLPFWRWDPSRVLASTAVQGPAHWWLTVCMLQSLRGTRRMEKVLGILIWIIERKKWYDARAMIIDMYGPSNRRPTGCFYQPFPQAG